MDGTALALTIIGSVMTLLSVSIAFLTFWFNRKKDSSTDGEWKGVLKADIEHIKSGIDDLKTDNKDIKADIKSLDSRITIVEQSTKSAHHRLDTMERNQDRRELHNV